MAIKFQYNKTSLQSLDKQLKMRVRALPTIKNKESALRLEVKKAKEVAEESVKKKLACELLAKKKKLEPSDKEYEKKVEEYAEKAGYEDVDAFRKAYDEDTIRATILQEAVANYLLESSVQVEAASTDNSTDGSSGGEE